MFLHWLCFVTLELWILRSAAMLSADVRRGLMPLAKVMSAERKLILISRFSSLAHAAFTGWRIYLV